MISLLLENRLFHMQYGTFVRTKQLDRQTKISNIDANIAAHMVRMHSPTLSMGISVCFYRQTSQTIRVMIYQEK